MGRNVVNTNINTKYWKERSFSSEHNPDLVRVFSIPVRVFSIQSNLVYIK